jgi:hypothetical protein
MKPSDRYSHCSQITPAFMPSTILNEACPYCNDTGLRCVSKPTPPEAIPPINEWPNGCITVRCSYVYVTCVCRGGPAFPEK